MVRALLFGFVTLLCACASKPTPAAPGPDVQITLSRASGGDWIADYRFNRAAPAWLLPRTHLDLDGQPWRQRSWTVETSGVRLERRGRYDVLTGDGAPLKAARIRVRPFTRDLRADYTPVLGFSDGAVAHYSETLRPYAPRFGRRRRGASA